VVIAFFLFTSRYRLASAILNGQQQKENAARGYRTAHGNRILPESGMREYA
jgi:hypothetical protein